MDAFSNQSSTQPTEFSAKRRIKRLKKQKKSTAPNFATQKTSTN
jgi:hypothetical protein